MSTATPRIHAFRPSGQLLAVQKRSRRFCSAVMDLIKGELNIHVAVQILPEIRQFKAKNVSLQV